MKTIAKINKMHNETNEQAVKIMKNQRKTMKTYENRCHILKT